MDKEYHIMHMNDIVAEADAYSVINVIKPELCPEAEGAFLSDFRSRLMKQRKKELGLTNKELSNISGVDK